jgi:hypothetical protein
MKLYAMHFFMSRIITFTKDSAKKAIEVLPRPFQLPYKRSQSSKLLLHQIKMEMNDLQLEMTTKVLDGLEKALRSRSRPTWATSFCVIMILCMCIEAVQAAVDGAVVQSILEQRGSNKPSVSREEGFAVCRQLEEKVFEECKEIFHIVYKSKPGRNERGRFNPILDGIEDDTSQGIDEEELVKDVRRVMNNHRKHIES